ncbi:protein amnionless [Cydia strobilella]|uniref:protein amnionless n=1 Tax=Cydia strobilella TaxID=1100964 RepID=UPI003006E5F7
MTVLILSAVFALTSSAKVTWQPNTNFNIASNFADGKLPCSKETVIFSETIQGSVRIQGDTAAQEFILPETGDILLDGTLFIGANDKDQCLEGNKYFIDKTVSSWADPDVWSSPLYNEATPDAERVPCIGDTVDFPVNTTFAIKLPELTQTVKKVIVSGLNYNLYSLLHHIMHQDDSQQFYVNSIRGIGIRIKEDGCRSPIKGCPCQEYPLKIECDLKFCPVPQCLYPIKPIGFCCKICGGAISFEREQNFNLMELKDMVERVVASYSDDNIVYHIGIVEGNKVQLVVTEKYEYKGQSAMAAHDVNGQILKGWSSGVQAVSLSGGPLSDANYGLKIAFSMLFVVILVFGVLYAYYYKIPVPRIHLPTIPSFGRGSTAGLLSRFDRRTESIVSLTRRDSTVTVASSAGVGTAFRNPLYSSKRGRVDVVESEVDNDNM